MPSVRDTPFRLLQSTLAPSPASSKPSAPKLSPPNQKPTLVPPPLPSSAAAQQRHCFLRPPATFLLTSFPAFSLLRVTDSVSLSTFSSHAPDSLQQLLMLSTTEISKFTIF
ncbi:hypothetical protein Ancab_039668 [Ancistrocladus abbreviatus]